MLSTQDVPRLVRRVRFRWDAVRGSHVLLFPEGVLVLNGSAGEVLARVDGLRTVEDIAKALVAAHPDAPPDVISRDVLDVLGRVHARGFIERVGVPP